MSECGEVGGAREHAQAGWDKDGMWMGQVVEGRGMIGLVVGGGTLCLFAVRAIPNDDTRTTPADETSAPTWCLEVVGIGRHAYSTYVHTWVGSCSRRYGESCWSAALHNGCSAGVSGGLSGVMVLLLFYMYHHRPRVQDDVRLDAGIVCDVFCSRCRLAVCIVRLLSPNHVRKRQLPSSHSSQHMRPSHSSHPLISCRSTTDCIRIGTSPPRHRDLPLFHSFSPWPTPPIPGRHAIPPQ